MKATANPPWLRDLLGTEPPRSKSLIVTFLGDALAPLGGGIWMGDLIGVAALFGLNERLVRTCVYRLAEEGWLEARKEGRRTRYLITPLGLRRIAHADRRIYDPPLQAWDGVWTLVVPARAASDPPDRVELRKELEWEGFGQVVPGVFAHPDADRAMLADILDRLRMRDSVAVLAANDLSTLGGAPLAQLVRGSWRFDELDAQYRHFIEQFEQARAEILRAPPAPQHAFVARIWLIHQFRRVSLHDPHLPAPMMPAGWVGGHAYEVCSEIYRALWAPSEAYLHACLGVGRETVSAAAARRFAAIRPDASAPRQWSRS